MSYYDDFRNENQWEPRQIEQPRSPGGFTRKSAAALVAVCVLSSAAVGFGGGYFAAGLRAPVIVEAPSSSSAAPMVSTPSSSADSAVSEPAAGGAKSVAQIVSEVSDAVVEIRCNVTEIIWGFEQTGEGAGSGVIISEDGYLVTNNHVVESADKITVRLKNGESYEATLIGTDEVSDVAVLKIDATGLTAVTMGESSALRVGDETVAIGNPLGELGGTVTNGIVSALDREVTIDGETMTLLQTNAAINPGNSGGGLFNDRGQLIGIVVAKSSGSDIEGLGFAIPIDNAKKVIEDLMGQGYVGGRAVLGVSLIDITDARTALYYRVNEPGTYVAQIQEDSAAAEAGLQVGDRVVSADGTEIESSTTLRSIIRKHSAGDTLELVISRSGQRITVSVVLKEDVPEALKQTKEA